MKLNRAVYNKGLSIVLCLVLVSTGTLGVVLCVGEDGHLAIEVAGSSCCRGASLHGLAQSPVLSADEGGSYHEGDCGSCMDTTISGPLFRSTDSLSRGETTLLSVALPASVPALCQAIPLDGLISDTSSPISYFTPLRSIVLLA